MHRRKSEGNRERERGRKRERGRRQRVRKLKELCLIEVII